MPPFPIYLISSQNAKYLQVNPTIMKGVHVTVDIIENYKKLTFSNHDLRNFLELHMSKCMPSVQLVEGVTIQLVPMDQARGLQKSSILSLLYMPHFVRNIEVKMFLKQVLVYFHGGCLWLDNCIFVDVDLINSIIVFPKLVFEPVPFFAGMDQDISLVT